MNWGYPNPFTNEVTVKSEDIDGMGHANNASYVVWCESCAWNHSQALGLSIDDYRKLDRGVAISRATYEYCLPSFANDRLLIGTWLTACDGKLRLERQFQIVNSATEETVLRGQWNMICVSLATGKPARLPEEFIAIYGGAIVNN